MYTGLNTVEIIGMFAPTAATTLDTRGRKMRKYKCEVALAAEDDIAGYVYLTKEQYEAVKYATDISNWEVFERTGDWHGWFNIYCDEIQEGNDGSVTA